MIRRSADLLLAHSPLQPLFRWRASRKLTVLAYHGVDDLDRFAAQLDWIRSHSHVVAPMDVFEALRRGSGLPRRALLITFDDGAHSLVEHGLPLLRDRGLPALAFVVAGLIDSHKPFWWDEAQVLAAAGGESPRAPGHRGRNLVDALKRMSDADRRAALDELRVSAGPASRPRARQLTRADLLRLESSGIAIGNHTLSHPCLDRCSDSAVVDEIEQAHDLLVTLLGHHPRAFAYPNGNHDARATATLRRLGYDAAFLFDHRLCEVPVSDRFAVSRVRVNSHTGLDRLRTIVSGLHPALHRLRGRD